VIDGFFSFSCAYFSILLRGESLLSPRFVFPQRGGWDMAEVFRTPKVSGAVADPLWKAHYILQL
jgi:hypothetical protein